MLYSIKNWPVSIKFQPYIHQLLAIILDLKLANLGPKNCHEIQKFNFSHLLDIIVGTLSETVQGQLKIIQYILYCNSTVPYIRLYTFNDIVYINGWHLRIMYKTLSLGLSLERLLHSIFEMEQSLESPQSLPQLYMVYSPWYCPWRAFIVLIKHLKVLPLCARISLVI